MFQEKAFVTGHNGFIGKHLLERLKARRTYLYNRDEPVESLATFKPNYIYHLAAEIYKEDEMLDSNILLTYKLLEQARKLPDLKAFIYIGSSSEYGRKDHPMSETDYLDPTNMYEATKGAGTLLCQAYARTYGVPVVIARPFSLYGEHEPRKRFIPTIIKNIKKHRRLDISPGVHDFIHIDDFIDGLFILAENTHPGEIYNFGTGVQTSNEELVELIEDIIGDKALKALKALIDPLHNYDSDCWVADISKAEELGWKPNHTLESGLTLTVKQISKPKNYFNKRS